MRGALLAAPLVLLAGCVAPAPEGGLEAENERLRTELGGARQTIDRLEAERASLEDTVNEQADVIEVLNTEKSSRAQASSRLRNETRSFVRSEIQDFKRFLQDSELLDFVGGELVSRNHADDEPLLLADLGNPVPADGQLSAVGGYFNGPGELQVKVMRPIEDELVVLWESEPIQIDGAGRKRVEFDTAVGVERGDVVGYWFPTAVNVPFDRGTGDVRYADDPVSLGKSLRPRDLEGEDEGRAYSVGVFGLLD